MQWNVSCWPLLWIPADFKYDSRMIDYFVISSARTPIDTSFLLSPSRYSSFLLRGTRY